MTKKPIDIDVSQTMKNALDDLEKIEFEFSIDEPEGKAKRIEGRLVAHIRDKKDPS